MSTKESIRRPFEVWTPRLFPETHNLEQIPIYLIRLLEEIKPHTKSGPFGMYDLSAHGSAILRMVLCEAPNYAPENYWKMPEIFGILIALKKQNVDYIGSSELVQNTVKRLHQGPDQDWQGFWVDGWNDDDLLSLVSSIPLPDSKIKVKINQVPLGQWNRGDPRKKTDIVILRKNEKVWQTAMTLEICRGLENHELFLGGRLQPNFALLENLAIASLEVISDNGIKKWCYVMDPFIEEILQARLMKIDNPRPKLNSHLDYPALNRLFLEYMWYGKESLDKYALKILGIDEFGYKMMGWKTGALAHLPIVTAENIELFQMRQGDNLNQAILGSTYDIDQWIFLAWITGYLSHTRLGKMIEADPELIADWVKYNYFDPSHPFDLDLNCSEAEQIIRMANVVSAKSWLNQNMLSRPITQENIRDIGPFRFLRFLKERGLLPKNTELIMTKYAELIDAILWNQERLAEIK